MALVGGAGTFSVNAEAVSPDHSNTLERLIRRIRQFLLPIIFSVFAIIFIILVFVFWSLDKQQNQEFKKNLFSTTYYGTQGQLLPLDNRTEFILSDSAPRDRVLWRRYDYPTAYSNHSSLRIYVCPAQTAVDVQSKLTVFLGTGQTEPTAPVADFKWEVHDDTTYKKCSSISTHALDCHPQSMYLGFQSTQLAFQPFTFTLYIDLGDQCKPSNMYNILYLVFVGLTAATMLAVGVSLCFAGNCLGDGGKKERQASTAIRVGWMDSDKNKHKTGAAFRNKLTAAPVQSQSSISQQQQPHLPPLKSTSVSTRTTTPRAGIGRTAVSGSGGAATLPRPVSMPAFTKPPVTTKLSPSVQLTSSPSSSTHSTPRSPTSPASPKGLSSLPSPKEKAPISSKLKDYFSNNTNSNTPSSKITVAPASTSSATDIETTSANHIPSNNTNNHNFTGDLATEHSSA